ncbi:hypothetical protein BV898_19514 [Hypsibius exemplaris]|uniref:Ninjurin-1 n=1 Tax=Hypsibius exemplaris TaxID=2072580 RepID=A0A9X6NJQ1_HYPEX|nr:hypothetical protein BV898_19514 [Hypsibius exemplaris]
MEGGKRQYTALPTTPSDGAPETVLQHLDGEPAVDNTDGQPPPSRKWSNESAKGKTRSLPVRGTADHGDDDVERNGAQPNGSRPRSRSSSQGSGLDEDEAGIPKNTFPFSESRDAPFKSRKCVIQGMMDISLLTANASQLKNLMETENHPNYNLCMALLLLSISLQIFVTTLLLFYSYTKKILAAASLSQKKKEIYRHCMIFMVQFRWVCDLFIFYILAINIFISSFISHGKAYIPHENTESAWIQEMFRQRAAAMDYVPNVTNAPTLP